MKIGIYGAGFVGSTIAYSLCLLNLAEQIFIYDKNIEKAKANVYDIQDGIHLTNIKIANLSELYKTDLIIVCIGNSLLLKKEKGRYEEKTINNDAINILCKELKKNNYNGFIINVSNPNDIISHSIYKIIKNKEKIFGTGTWLDTNRLKNQIENISIIGEHGNGVIDTNYKKNIQIRYQTILNGKGYTNFGISKIVCDIVKIIQQQKEHKVILSVYNNGKFTSRSVLLSNKGVKNDTKTSS